MTSARPMPRLAPVIKTALFAMFISFSLPKRAHASTILSCPIDDVRPLRRRGAAVFVVPVPPLVRRSLRIALRRVLPLFLAPERRDVEVVPSAPHLLVAAVVD